MPLGKVPRNEQSFVSNHSEFLEDLLPLRSTTTTFSPKRTAFLPPGGSNANDSDSSLPPLVVIVVRLVPVAEELRLIRRRDGDRDGRKEEDEEGVGLAEAGEVNGCLMEDRRLADWTLARGGREVNPFAICSMVGGGDTASTRPYRMAATADSMSSGAGVGEDLFNAPRRFFIEFITRDDILSFSPSRSLSLLLLSRLSLATGGGSFSVMMGGPPLLVDAIIGGSEAEEGT